MAYKPQSLVYHRVTALARWLPALVWMGIIFLLSHQPKSELAAAQPSAFFSADDVDWNRFWQLFFTVDWDTVAGKSAHMMVFGMLAYLLWRAWPQRGFVLTVAVLYGFSDEFHQLFIPGRTGRLLDVCFDGLGALLVLWWLTWRTKRQS